MNDWSIESWNNFEDDDSAAADVSLDDVVTVHICEDMTCPRCDSARIIQNWKYPERMCCVDCGIIFSIEQN